MILHRQYIVVKGVYDIPANDLLQQVAVEVIVEMHARSELSMNDQSSAARSSINVFTVYPLSLRIVESNTALSRGMGNLLKICSPGAPGSTNDIFLVPTDFASLFYNA